VIAVLIYKATNRVNGKCYIGQTRGTLGARRKAHLREAKEDPLKGHYFQWALREHGPAAFGWEILCTCESQQELDAKEQEFIAAHDAMNPDHGYNLASGGAGDREDGKLRSLILGWPANAALTQRELAELGIYRQLISKYTTHGWVKKLGTGAYARSGDTVDWRGGLYALQTQLGMTVHVGADTALTHLGRAHFVPLGSRQRVVLISDQPEQLPAWFRRYPWNAEVKHHCLDLFDAIPEGASAEMDYGGFQFLLSSPERAIMEQLRLARTNSGIDYALELMNGLSTLRPNVVQALLEACRSIKVKRLFLWAAEAAQHHWVELLNSDAIDLGKGKRQLYKGGELDKKYQITVPRTEELPDV
jgi:hypothetical protein